VELKDAIRTREAVREYQDKPVPEDRLKNILEAARLAPTAANRQPIKLVVVRDAKTRRELAQAANGQAFVGEAPVVIAVVATVIQHIMPCGIPSYPIDAAIVADHMTLAAADEGLGTCWIGAFSQDGVRRILGVPETSLVVTLLPLGYPKTHRGTKPRKSPEEFVCYETYKV
jgi:nitroreductase